MSKIRCCLGCADRKLFCHSNCEKYINEKALNDATRTLISEKRNRENIYKLYHAERIRKTKKK